jgi:signal transduction histidine kinase
MAILSHELRNMLAPIATALHVYSRTAEPERDPELLEIAMVHTHRASRLVDDIFDATRLVTGKLKLHREIIDLRDIAQLVVRSVSPELQRRHQELRVTICNESLPLYADPLRLEQVCMNLFHNASKHTPEHSCIWLQVRRENNSAVLQVRDSGCGMKPELISNIFDFYSQGETDGHGPGGLGVGLALAKSFVELHGGTIKAHSDGPGCGADFTVTLPCTH